MGMRRAYQEVVVDNLPDWYKNYHRRLNQPHPIWIFRWWEYLLRVIFMSSGRERVAITNNTIMAAYSEADRNRHSLELEQAKHTADYRVHHKIQQTINKILASDASPEAKVAAISALTQE